MWNLIKFNSMVIETIDDMRNLQIIMWYQYILN